MWVHLTPIPERRRGVFCNLFFPQTELALWGSGAFKAGGTSVAPARRLVGAFSSQNVGHGNFEKKKWLWLKRAGDPHPRSRATGVLFS